MQGPQFSRRAGFGLGLDDQAPADPVAWATAQMAEVQPLFDGGGLPSTAEGQKARADYLAAKKQLEISLVNRPQDLGEKFRQFNFERKIAPVGWEYHARGRAAAFGPVPVFERLWHFWCNHFTVSGVGNEIALLIGPYHREAIRKNLAGTFAELVFAATTHVAMLDFLDNARSIGPNSQFAKTLASRPQARARGLNENHARELLELHTVSSVAPYTQHDVVELALIMTGWFDGTFAQERHEPGPRTFLGKTYPDRGAETLRGVITDITAMPQTAQFVSRKLAIAFVADAPPDAAVNHIVAAWKASGGKLPAIHRALFEAVERWGGEHIKFLPPEAWFIQCARILNAPMFSRPGEGFVIGEAAWSIVGWYRELGQNVFFVDQPNGWSDRKNDWVSPELIDRRVRFGAPFLNALNKSGRLKSDHLQSAVSRNWPEQGGVLGQLLAGAASSVERFQRFTGSPFMLRC